MVASLADCASPWQSSPAAAVAAAVALAALAAAAAAAAAASPAQQLPLLGASAVIPLPAPLGPTGPSTQPDHWLQACRISPLKEQVEWRLADLLQLWCHTRQPHLLQSF